MASYRIFRLKDSLRAQFRQLPHVSGVSKVKLKDYEERGSVEAVTPYAAWSALQGSEEDALQVGDVLMDDQAGEVRIIKFVGFEPAEWVVPEVKLPGDMILGTATGSPPSTPHSAS
jgi:hypothetical protein